MDYFSVLSCQVIDEADRMMDEIKQDWLKQVEDAVYQHRPRPGPLNVFSAARMEMPVSRIQYFNWDHLSSEQFLTELNYS